MKSFDRWFSEQVAPEPTTPPAVGFEDGAVCNRDGCDGLIEFAPEDCSCHISSPCNQCVEHGLHCPDCGWRQDGVD